MKILLVNTFYPPVQVGGAENSVHELAKALVADGHSVAVATLGPKGAEVEELREGVRVYRKYSSVVDPYFPGKAMERNLFWKLSWHLRESFRPLIWLFLSRVIRAERPDVIHTNAPGGFGAAAWLARWRVPRVHTLRDFYTICVSFRTLRAGKNCERQCSSCRFVRAAVGGASERAKEIVSISEATAVRHQQLGRYVGRSISVIGNRPAQYVTSPHDAHTECVYGFIGRVEDYKGVWLALAAFGRIGDPDSRFLVAGSASEDDTRRIETWGDDRVEYLGTVKPADFYASVDVVVVPSQWHEPFGRVAAEAALSGCAVIVSDLGGLPEAAAEAKHAIVVRDWSSEEAWAAAMSELSDFRSLGSADEPADRSAVIAAAYAEVYERAAGSSLVRPGLED